MIRFTVHLSAPSPRPVSVRYRTEDGTAKAGKDYRAVAGVVEFVPGAVAATIAVPLLRDDLDWREETFTVHLEQSTHGRIAKAVAVATIREAGSVAQNVLTAYAARFVRTSSVQVVEALQERVRTGVDASVCGAEDRANLVRLLADGIRLAAVAGRVAWGVSCIEECGGVWREIWRVGARGVPAVPRSGSGGAPSAWVGVYWIVRGGLSVGETLDGGSGRGTQPGRWIVRGASGHGGAVVRADGGVSVCGLPAPDRRHLGEWRLRSGSGGRDGPVGAAELGLRCARGSGDSGVDAGAAVELPRGCLVCGCHGIGTGCDGSGLPDPSGDGGAIGSGGLGSSVCGGECASGRRERREGTGDGVGRRDPVVGSGVAP